MPLYPQSFIGFVGDTRQAMTDMFTAANSKLAVTMIQASSVVLEAFTGSQITLEPTFTYPNGNRGPIIKLKPSGISDYASIGAWDDDNFIPTMYMRSSQYEDQYVIYEQSSRAAQMGSYEYDRLLSRTRVEPTEFFAKASNIGFEMIMGVDEFHIQNHGRGRGPHIQIVGDEAKVSFRGSTGNVSGGEFIVKNDSVEVLARDDTDTWFGGGRIMVTKDRVRIGYCDYFDGWPCYFNMANTAQAFGNGWW